VGVWECGGVVKSMIPAAIPSKREPYDAPKFRSLGVLVQSLKITFHSESSAPK